MLSRNPLAMATVLSLALHLGLLLWGPRFYMENAVEQGCQKLVVSFGTIELPAVAMRAEASERPPVEKLPMPMADDPVELPVIPMPDLEEELVEPDLAEQPREPVKLPSIEDIPLVPDVLAFRPRTERQPPVPVVPSENETPGVPERTAGAVADAKARFLAEVVGRIQRAKRYPAEARRAGAEGTARVEFVLSARGKVLSVRLAASSGHVSLDRESVSMIRRAAPYPRIPGELRLAEIKLALPLAFELEK